LDTELLDVVGMIYDAVIEPSRWESVIETIRVRHGWHNASMSVIAPTAQRMVILNLALNVPENFFEEAPRHVDDVVAMWGGPARLAQLPLEEPLLQSSITDPATWMDNTYFRTWAHPQGIVDQVAMALARDSTTLANIAFSLHKSRPTAPEAALEELRLLAPHLRRAATISRILEREATRAATFEAALDAAGSGAVLVRGDMEIVHANATAETMLRSGDPIRSSGGRLRLINELVPGHLETAVQAAAAGAAAIGRRGIGIPARRRDGSPLVTHVMPLEARLGTRSSADAVVFLADGGAEPLPTDRLSLLFGLTPAETRVFEMAASGSSPDQMAERLGIAPSTVRTHLQRVYEKTGRHRQAELVALGQELKLLP
jgi:DNA-binding CsgD family transcriptional regulator